MAAAGGWARPLMAYETTKVAVPKSQGDIRTLLVRFGADGFEFSEGVGNDGRSLATIAFRTRGLLIRMRVALKEPDTAAIAKKVRLARSKKRDEIVAEMMEQEARRIWRVLHWTLKSRLEAVEERVETFEEAFLPHIVDPRSDETVFEMLTRTGGLKQLGAGEPDPV